MSDELPSLEELQRQIDGVKSRTGYKEQDEAATGGQEPGAGQAMRMGVELVSGVAVGSVIGYFLDRWLHTMPLFFVVCFFIGAAAGFRNMIRETKNAGRNE